MRSLKSLVVCGVFFSGKLFAAQGGVDSANLFGVIKQGGPLMFVLVALFVVVLTIVIERLIYFTIHKAWSNKEVEGLMNDTVESSKIVYREELENLLHNEKTSYTDGLERGLSLLAGIGNMAPIVGFLGTVLGMISAFGSIAVATTVNAKVVAVGIQVALVTTAGGLIVAAPALIAYYFLIHIVQLRNSHGDSVISSHIKSVPSVASVLAGSTSNERSI